MIRPLSYFVALLLAGSALGAGYGALAPRKRATPEEPSRPLPAAAPVNTPASPAPSSAPANTPTPPPPVVVAAAEVAPATPAPSAPAPKAAPAFKPRGDVEISSEGGFEYDGETGRVIYKGKVQVLDPAKDPRTIITCDWLSTILPPAGGKVGEIIALTNVVIKVRDDKGAQMATGARAVFNATNDTITITGNPVVEMPSGTLFGDQYVIYNRLTEKFEAPGRIKMVARQGAPLPIPGFSSTNSPAIKNNPAPKP